MRCFDAGNMTRALMTRTERAQVTKHLIECPTCQRNAMEFAQRLLQSVSLLHSVSSLMFAYRQMAEDAKDPEFGAIIHG